MNQSATPSATRSDARRVKSTDETIKETIESIIIAFVLTFVFRAFVVEAFVIPTGSMAPTLLGRHVRAHCPECGYDMRVDLSDRAVTGRPYDLTCPMCFETVTLSPRQQTRSGDRILVQKYVYWLSAPRRWDVVVFKAPHQPRTNFIKRLVGLPNETIALLDGNVYAKPRDGQWAIARKTDPAANPHWEQIQRAVWQPIHHSKYVPLDQGDAGPDDFSNQPRWGNPWRVAQGDWTYPAAGGYHFHGKSADAGVLRFDFDSLDQRMNYGSAEPRYPYDQLGERYYGDLQQAGRVLWDVIEDVRLAATVQPQQPNATVALSTTARSENDTVVVEAVFGEQGEVQLRSEGLVMRSAKLPHPIPTDRATEFELWHVDQEFLLWMDGVLLVRHPIDLSWEAILQRPPPPALPRPQIALSGGPAIIHRIELDRDLYYGVRNDYGQLAHGGFERGRDGQIRVRNPHRLDAEEFFCLGDNGPLSSDARYWAIEYGTRIDPWIDRLMYTDDDGSHAGVVPRRLLIGRAFFVYWPAQLPLNDARPGLVPNFGELRFIH